MQRELRRVALVIFAMFASLFLASSTIQVLAADGYNSDSRNVRNLYDSYKTKRGAILLDGQPIAQSITSADSFHYQRTYANDMYSAITGFYSMYQGATGLESAMNSYLSGKNSSQFFEQINAMLSGNPVAGGSVELTINPAAQKAAWQAMGNLKGAVVAIEPKTGKILAFVSKPGFDANLLAVHAGSQSNANYAKLLADAGKPLINRTISGDLYAPGSVFKIIVAAAAIESGMFTPQTKIPNPTRYRLPGTSTYIYNSGEGKCGGKSTVTMADALRLSCNIPFAQIGVALGQDRIR
ncbi:MAG: hypothetical protein RL670_793, partial [Actinomycetota bacterium]